MKKVILIVGVLFLSFAAFGFISDDKGDSGKWAKINSFIYIDRSSITKKNYSASGVFKVYNIPESELYKDYSDVYYEIIEYEVDCKDPSISIARSKSYDKNGVLLDEYINEHGYGCICPCLVYDDIYLRELCK